MPGFVSGLCQLDVEYMHYGLRHVTGVSGKMIRG